MRKADIEVGETYFAAKGRSYVRGERKVKVIAIGAHRNSQTAVRWDVEKKLGYTREWVDEVRGNRDLSDNKKDRILRDKKQEVARELDRLDKANPFNIDGKGTGILVESTGNYYADVAKATTSPERFAERYPNYAEKATRLLVEARELVCTWDEHIRHTKASAVAAEKAAAARSEREAALEVQRAVARKLLAERGIENVFVSNYDARVNLSLEDLIELLTRIPEEVAA
jgi:hypothetical protein